MKVYNSNGILLIVALGGLMLGLETTSLAVFLASDVFMDFFEYPGPLLQGIVGASNPAAAFFGCWIAGAISDRFGRIAGLQVGSSLWCAGSIVSVFAIDIWMLIAGRAVKGLSVGIFSSILSVYLLEVTPPFRRGLGTATLQWCLTWGIMIMFYLSFFCGFIENDMSFRIAWAIEGVPGLVLLVLSFFLPESPKWYGSRGRWHESIEVSNKLFSKEVAVPLVEEEVGENETASTRNLVELDMAIERCGGDSKSCSYADLFRPALRSHLFAGILTQTIVQLSGIGVLMYYLVFVCEMIGLQGQTKIVSASIQYVVNVLFTIFPILLIEKMRRKDVLVFGALSLGLCISAIGIVMGVFGHEVPPIGGNESVVWEVSGTPGSWVLALCFLFVAIFAATLSCAAWLYTNEIFPVRAKAKGSAICMAVSWTVNFLLTFLAPLSLSSLKWGTFVVFGGFSLAGASIMGLWFPETYGKSELEIDEIFGVRIMDIEKESVSVHSEHETKRTSVRIRRQTVGRNSNHIIDLTHIPPSDGDLAYTPETLRPVQQSRPVSNNETFKLSVDGNVRLPPPGSSASARTPNPEIQSVTATGSPRKSFTAQSSPFLKKMGCPFEEPEIFSDPESGKSGFASASASANVKKHPSTLTSEEGSATPDGYYNLSSGDSPFLNGYL